MEKKSIRTLAIVLFTIVLFAGCSGENFDFILPTNGIYKVDAYINETPLSVSSIIRQNDTVSPYFTNPLSNDPDVHGLIVFLQSPSGMLIGKKIWYTLGTETSPPKDTEKPAEPPAQPADPGTAASPSGGTVQPNPPAPAAPANPPATGTNPPTAATPPAPAANPAEPEASPETPLSARRANVIGDLSQYRIIPVDRLDRNLPAFSMSESIEIGFYLMVFQILGEKDLLYTVEKPVSFLGNAEFVFETIQHYLPGSSINAHLIPSGINLLLEAEIGSDSRLDPYIIWYDGKKRIGEGFLSAGLDKLIWKVPEKNGFHTIKSVVYPIKPQENVPINGAVRELSLPVSVKSKNTGYFEKQADTFIHWYRFQSNLLDAKAPGDSLSGLTLPDQRKPLWMPYNTMYGFAAEGPCFLPNTSFRFGSAEEAAADFAFHTVPLADGALFAASFKTFAKTDVAPGQPLKVTASFKSQSLILTVSLGDESYQETVDMTEINLHGFITPRIALRLRRSQISASIAVDEAGTAPKEITLSLKDSITGEGAFQLGEADAAEPIFLIDELGVSFTKKTLTQEPEVLEAEKETEKTETQSSGTERLAETPHAAESV
ncbi:MAG: hypothetical protein LBG87_06330 [Spirochaetaceae bacterium]|jgi:hypothetical protein|nr:hypothetical protein [Spirochaetaceae bacterium]